MKRSDKQQGGQQAAGILGENKMVISEKRLNDYRGNQVWKFKEDNGDIYYFYQDQEGNVIDVYSTLEKLKKDNKNY